MAILCCIFCFWVVVDVCSEVVELCHDAQTSAACMSLHFSSSFKCLWNAVPDQHTGTTGLTSKLSSGLILLYGLLDNTLLLCVHFEFLHPDVWWVKLNIILCFNHFFIWNFWLLCLKAIIPAAFCLAIVQWITGGTYCGLLCLLLWP